jgi:DNA-binding MarR family transcriptional regulator
MTEDEEAPLLAAMPSRLLAQASAIAGRLVGDGLAATGAHRYQVAVLATLEAFGPSSQAALSRRIGLDRSDVVATLAALEAEGLVARAVDAGDRRRNVVSLTEAGAVRLTELDGRLAALQSALLAPLEAGQRAELVALLQALVRHHRGRWP